MGPKDIASTSSGEKGETITIIAWYSAKGVYSTPTYVIKKTNENKACANGMPPGLKIYMSPKSAYVNDIFFKYLININWKLYIKQQPMSTIYFSNG